MQIDCQALWEVTQAVLVAQLLYASPAWSGFLKADETNKLQMVLNKARYGFLPLSCTGTIDEMFESSDNTMFLAMLRNPDHVLHFLLPLPRQLDMIYVSVVTA